MSTWIPYSFTIVLSVFRVVSFQCVNPEQLKRLNSMEVDVKGESHTTCWTDRL